MKRLAILLAMITVALALPATGALAKKGNKPPKPATTYDVTMSFVEDQGLATTCDTNGAIEMGGSLNNVLSAPGADLAMMVPIDWWRDYDAGWGAPTLNDPVDPPEPFTGCHGLSQSAIDTDSFGGALWLTFGQDAAGQETVTFQWRFDYYWEFEQRGKRDVQTVLELFELTSVEIPWSPTLEEDGALVGTVEGLFAVALFTKEGRTITHRFEEIGTADLSFDLRISPTG